MSGRPKRPIYFLVFWTLFTHLSHFGRADGPKINEEIESVIKSLSLGTPYAVLAPLISEENNQQILLVGERDEDKIPYYETTLQRNNGVQKANFGDSRLDIPFLMLTGIPIFYKTAIPMFGFAVQVVNRGNRPEDVFLMLFLPFLPAILPALLDFSVGQRYEMANRIFYPLPSHHRNKQRMRKASRFFYKVYREANQSSFVFLINSQLLKSFFKNLTRTERFKIVQPYKILK